MTNLKNPPKGSRLDPSPLMGGIIRFAIFVRGETGAEYRSAQGDYMNKMPTF